MTIVDIANSTPALKAYEEGRKFLARGHKVYQLAWSKNAKMTAMHVYTSTNYVPLVNRGYFHVFNAAEINKLIGEELFVD